MTVTLDRDDDNRKKKNQSSIPSTEHYDLLRDNLSITINAGENVCIPDTNNSLGDTPADNSTLNQD